MHRPFGGCVRALIFDRGSRGGIRISHDEMVDGETGMGKPLAPQGLKVYADFTALLSGAKNSRPGETIMETPFVFTERHHQKTEAKRQGG